ncbi:MAG: hypothetical protein COX79_01850 [Candidatus Levybacteria bacterium CG_4_10_14_0_2_um_filter_36_16]|nr:MAG: hypothetical protein AUK12_00405 [Candidatus Levybacteria bacterium CG2_30_37_29]PIR79464.1 MAG: hypothetical protein COU26_00985 [Candidatus Levybacteria bacterium CG10_big_fil_rev_8_21_14_0_10_36_30]PIZ97575.1 MAG: hypothetical protein COX79_01850 [Candidatus Levybacteria bacterium CG_4_10_14_0_2_um_filter_36_16]
MENVRIFDLLVVYAQSVATSASSQACENLMPFSLLGGKPHYNNAYAFFLNTCKKNNISAALTTTSDIISGGKCRSYWEYIDSGWTKTNNKCYSKLVFNKFSPVRSSQPINQLLFFSNTGVLPFNDSYLHPLFDDKLLTFTALPEFSIPTVNIAYNSKNSIIKAVKELKNLVASHPHRNDFSADFIIKDRFGAGGVDIYKIGSSYQKNIHEILQRREKTSFVIQPFVKFDKGFKFNNVMTATDIRIIFSRGKIIQQYIRMAKKGDFRCNEHQGATVKYIKIEDIPINVLTTARKIVSKLDRKNALFALDFVVSNEGNVYFLEGNINPGIYWGIDSKEDEKNTKKLINIIVKECERKIEGLKKSIDEGSNARCLHKN